jgi:hypothetical protein
MKKKSDLPYGFKSTITGFALAVVGPVLLITYYWREYAMFGNTSDMIGGAVTTGILIFGLIYNLIFFMVKFRGIDTLKATKEGVVSRVYGHRIPLISSPKIEVKFEDDPTPKRVYGFFGYFDRYVFKPGTKVVCYFYESGKIVMGYEKKEEDQEPTASPKR